MNLPKLSSRRAQFTPRKAHIALPLLIMAALYWLSSVPGTPLPAEQEVYALFQWVPPALQNALHVPVYATLAFTLRWALGAWPRVSSMAGLFACAIASVYGVFDEWHQSFVPGRYASLTDVAFNMAGAVVGIWLASRYGEAPARKQQP
jgi:VanZ family protein